MKAAFLKDLDLEQGLDKDVEHLSSGVLQCNDIAAVASQLVPQKCKTICCTPLSSDAPAGEMWARSWIRKTREG